MYDTVYRFNYSYTNVKIEGQNIIFNLNAKYNL